MARINNSPETVTVIGAGTVGLSVAWFLQERGIAVTVVDQVGVAAGSSWGNAGWLTPGLATPLPEPGVLSYGLRAVFSPSSPVYVPPTASPRLIAFLLRFARNSTARRWAKAMDALVPINRISLESFDDLNIGGVQEPTKKTERFIAAFTSKKERDTMSRELEHISSAGQEISYEELTASEVRALEPALSERTGPSLLLKKQRFIDPGAYADSLASAVQNRGAKFVFGSGVTSVDQEHNEAITRLSSGETFKSDAAVIATGTWLNELSKAHGIRMTVQAGRGYSFSSPMESVPEGPVYFPTQRVACTPIGDRLRVAGMMEFRKPDAALDQRRIKAIVDATRPMLDGINLDDRQDEWVGSRPCTVDGLPLIGPTKSPAIYVAGGHGMWGITLGPATGKLLAEQIATGSSPSELLPFNPLR